MRLDDTQTKAHVAVFSKSLDELECAAGSAGSGEEQRRHDSLP